MHDLIRYKCISPLRTSRSTAVPRRNARVWCKSPCQTVTFWPSPPSPSHAPKITICQDTLSLLCIFYIPFTVSLYESGAHASTACSNSAPAQKKWRNTVRHLYTSLISREHMIPFMPSDPSLSLSGLALPLISFEHFLFGLLLVPSLTYTCLISPSPLSIKYDSPNVLMFQDERSICRFARGIAMVWRRAEMDHDDDLGKDRGRSAVRELW